MKRTDKRTEVPTGEQISEADREGLKAMIEGAIGDGPPKPPYSETQIVSDYFALVQALELANSDLDDREVLPKMRRVLRDYANHMQA